MPSVRIAHTLHCPACNADVEWAGRSLQADETTYHCLNKDCGLDFVVEGLTRKRVQNFLKTRVQLSSRLYDRNDLEKLICEFAQYGVDS